MSTATWVWLQRLLPQKLLCRLIFSIARSRRNWIKSPLIAWFARHYRIDLAEAEITKLDAYPTFNSFFTRALRSGARAIDPGPSSVVSPVDGRLTEFGSIRGDRLIQAKGLHYGAADLLGESSEAAQTFLNGDFATIYLAPRDYHRVHMPLAGRLTQARYISGKRFSVNAATAQGIERLFCRNERLVARFDTDCGRLAMVLVGALNVSSIGTVTHGEIASGRDREWSGFEPVTFEKGAEFGRFNLGSTVILLFEQGAIRWGSELTDGESLRLGTKFGSMIDGIDR